MTNRMKSVVSVQTRENRKLLDATISRGRANSPPAEINFIFVAALTALKKTARFFGAVRWRRYTRITASRESNLQDYTLFGLRS